MYYRQRSCWGNRLCDTFSSCHLVLFEGESYFGIGHSRDQTLNGQRTAWVCFIARHWLSG